jgi:hypothetical protein
MPALALQPAHPNQSARSPVEIRETGRSRGTSGGVVSVPAAPEEQEISFLVNVPAPSGEPGESYSFDQNAIVIKAPLAQWTRALEQKFAHYAARIAAGIATQEETKEFAELQTTRERIYLARSGAEVLRDFEERQRTAALIRALQRYVEFTAH